jgi:hypothetical protein
MQMLGLLFTMILILLAFMLALTLMAAWQIHGANNDLHEAMLEAEEANETSKFRRHPNESK